jgi:hypothetical protein
LILMILMTAVAVVAKFDLMKFLAAYAAVYATGAIFTAILAIRGPIRAAARPDEIQPVNAFRVSIIP